MTSAPSMAAGAAAIFFIGLPIVGQAQEVQTFTVDCSLGQTISQAVLRGDERKPLVLRIRGTCNENVSINRDDVSLVGEPPAGAIVAAPGAGNAITVTGAHRILIDRLTVQGGNPRGISLVGGGNIDITNADIRSPAIHGINVQGAEAVNVTNCLIQYAGRSGISMTQGSLVVSGSQITSNAGFGIRAQQRSSLTVNGSTIASNASSGIEVTASQAFVSGTSITGNGTNRAQIENLRRGVTASQSPIQITNSTVAFNSGRGIAVEVGSSLNMSSTSVTGNEDDGVLLYLAAAANFARNVNVIGNTRAGLAVMVGSTVQLADGPMSFQSIWMSQASSLWVNPESGGLITVPGGIGCADFKSSANFSPRVDGPNYCGPF